MVGKKGKQMAETSESTSAVKTELSWVEKSGRLMAD
jgi:hypothetical protein